MNFNLKKLECYLDNYYNESASLIIDQRSLNILLALIEVEE